VLEKDAESKLDRTPYQRKLLSEVDEGREKLKTIREKRWNMIGHILRHENE